MSLVRGVLVFGVLVVALAGCPQHAPPEPPRDPPPTVGGGGAELRPGLTRSEAAPIESPDEGVRTAPALSAPGGGEAVADVLARPQRREQQAGAGGCQEGAHQAGESWKVECNTCHCDDDGQVTCTVMACNVTPGRPR